MIGLYYTNIEFIRIFFFFFNKKITLNFLRKTLKVNGIIVMQTLHDVKADIESKVEREQAEEYVVRSRNSDALLENFLTFINCQSQKYVLLEVRLTYN